MKKFAVDLLWVRPDKVGGTEFYIRNILDGMLELTDKFECILLVSVDNEETFRKYEIDKRFNCIVCTIKSAHIIRRIIWQNLFLGKLLLKKNIQVCFEPVYSKPVFQTNKIKFVTTIHDLQALHYPKYQSLIKVLWLRFNWWNTVRSSEKVIAISDFVRDDILKHYKVSPDKVITIYNAVVLDTNDVLPFSAIGNKYNIQKNQFFYTVSSMAPHKNLITLIKLMAKIKKEKLDLPNKLVITGIGGGDKHKLLALIKEMDLSENVIMTGFIETVERNTLYKYCHTFLFPSIFEGFGFPPVEAMMFGKNVVTTNETSIFEVTQGAAVYVQAPTSVAEWAEKLNYVKGDGSFFLTSIGSNYEKAMVAEKIICTILYLKGI